MDSALAGTGGEERDMSSIMADLEKINADAARRQRNKEAEYAYLSKLTGMSIAELDADLTAPDVETCADYEFFPPETVGDSIHTRTYPAGHVCHLGIPGAETCTGDPAKGPVAKEK